MWAVIPEEKADMESEEVVKSVEVLTYEQAFVELEAIVAALEGEERSLEEGLNLFERGQALARHCAKLLDQADLKVQQLTGEELVEFDAG
jgi:exodeoxyribonuclease VII small subunit